VLLRELQSLGLSIELLDKAEEAAALPAGAAEEFFGETEEEMEEATGVEAVGEVEEFPSEEAVGGS
jgi:hypothetical protein